MKKLLAPVLILLVQVVTLAQSLPYNVGIPPAPSGNIVEANNSIIISPGFNTGTNTYTFRILTNRYANDPLPSVNNYNFIKTEEAFFNYDANGLAQADPNEKNVTWQYYDGLGMPLQTVQSKASPDYRDIITPITYDEFGREVTKYLPYTVFNDSRYQNNAISAQSSFYNTSSPYKYLIKTDASPFIKTVFDDSPLSRVIEKGSPGSAWQPIAGQPSNGKTVKLEYLFHVDGTGAGQERIKQWGILSNSSGYYVTASGYYASNKLQVIVTKDEDGRQVRSYIDLQGRTVVRKIQSADNPSLNNDNDWAITYYIYDDMGMLRFVLQPKFIARNTVYDSYTAGGLSQFQMLDSLAFEYRYDERGRLIFKNVPGALETEMVYDQWDRLILTQDAKQRNAATKKWSFIKYDIFNRPIMSGEIASTNSRAQMVTAVNSDPDRFETTTSGNNVGYTLNTTYPTVTINDIYNITYYDNYVFINNLSLGTAYDPVIPSTFSGVVNTRIKNLVTGSKSRILDSNPVNWLITASYYDTEYRPLQIVADDHLGNKNRTTHEYYGITSWITKTQFSHGTSTTILTEMDYDHRGRVKSIWQTMDNNPSQRVLVASNRYNDLGQLIEKNIHSTNQGASFLQSIDYRYNIRGWLTHINNGALSNDGVINNDANDIFGMELKYNESVTINGTATAAQYNGNVASMQWKTNNLADDPEEKIYGFSYDKMNRLLDARYAAKTESGWDDVNKANNFNESIRYDKNGNISSLTRKAPINGSATDIDQLVYKYKGNALINVHDNSAYYDRNNPNPDFGFKEIMHSVSNTEYDYDKNGSMIFDLNKDIIDIQYNHLNLPKLVTLTGNRTIQYTYDAAGTKLRKLAKVGSTIVSQSDYVGGIHYEGATPVLKFVATPEGRVVKNGSAWDYEYFHKDHLGNTRAVYGYMKQVKEYKATMESELALKEDSPEMFTNVNARRAIAHNHTPASGLFTSPNESAETNGYTSKAVGPAKVLNVSNGDRVQLEVFGRYTTTTSNSNVITNLASLVTIAFDPLIIGETAVDALTDNIPWLTSTITRNTGAPKSYLCYILFDNNYVYQQFGYQAVTSEALAGHEQLYLDITIPASGYLYTYVANESNVSASTSVYFDDFSIIHTSATSALQVIQTQDYYPYGLAFNSYQRANSNDQHYLYNGKEQQHEHGIDWLDFGARMYMADIGRWGVVDPLADGMRRHSPYNYAFNNPIRFIDPDGMAPRPKVDDVASSHATRMDLTSAAYDEPEIHHGAEAPNTRTPVLEDGSLENIMTIGGTASPIESGIFNEPGRFIGASDSGNANSGNPGPGDPGTATCGPDPDPWYVQAWNAYWIKFHETAVVFNMDDDPNAEGWDSAPLRGLVQDNLTIEINAGAALGDGANVQYTLNFFTRGPEPGFFITQTMQNSAGGGSSYGFSFGQYNFSGPLNAMKRSSVEGLTNSYSLGYRSVGGTISLGYDNNGKPVWSGVSAGWGKTTGAVKSSGQTTILWPINKSK